MDTIKREDAIERIKPMAGEWTDNGFMVSYERVLSILNDIPSAEKQGKWITEERDSIYGKKIRLKCSECGDIFDVSEMAFPYERFCRYCGCRMKGANDE